VYTRFIITQVLLLALVLSCHGLSQETQAGAQPDVVATAIEHLRNLEYAESEHLMRQWLEKHPSDLRARNYLAIATLYQEMFKRGVLESRVYGHDGDIFKPSKVAITSEFQKEILDLLDKAQKAAEERLKPEGSDKEAMYWAGVSHGTRATYHFALRKEYMPALHEATEAYKYHRDLLKLDPQYVDAYLIVGMNNYVVGSLPWYVKVLATMSGRHGDRAEGLRQVKRAQEEGHYARDDARLMLAVLYQREKMHAEALTLYREMAHAYPRNYLLEYEVGALYGLLSDWRMSASTYDSILARHRADEPGYKEIPLAKVLYQAGQAYERFGENESALLRYTEAGRLPGSDRYIYISELAAGDVLMRLERRNEARQHYQRITDAVPLSEEGKLARRALTKLATD
jgi:tetratricopeptide repeat protein